jgi:phage portal protein BeeE
MAIEIRRTGDLRVKLAPDMLARVEKMASEYGMPGATFAAFAIASYINQQENNQKYTRMAVLDATRNSMPSGLDLEQLIGQIMPVMAQALSQENLPLEHEEPKGVK